MIQCGISDGVDRECVAIYLFEVGTWPCARVDHYYVSLEYDHDLLGEAECLQLLRDLVVMLLIDDVQSVELPHCEETLLCDGEDATGDHVDANRLRDFMVSRPQPGLHVQVIDIIGLVHFRIVRDSHLLDRARSHADNDPVVAKEDGLDVELGLDCSLLRV